MAESMWPRDLLASFLLMPAAAFPGLYAASRFLSTRPRLGPLVGYSIVFLYLSGLAELLLPLLTNGRSAWLDLATGFMLSSVALGGALWLSVNVPAWKALVAGAFSYATGLLILFALSALPM